MFEFDHTDSAKRREFTKSCMGGAMFLVLTNSISLRQMNKMNKGKAAAIGPLRKFMLLNLLNAPFYWYFYNDVSNQYFEMKRHLVEKYLISGDEILYKRPVHKK